jgi:hypothetical protein
MDLPKLNIDSLKTFLKLVAIERRLSTLIEGAPGVGKSEGVWQVTDEVDGVLVDVRLNLFDSVDFRGLPDFAEVTVKQGKTTISKKLTQWSMPDFLPFKGNPAFAQFADRPIVLFLDELGSASPAVFPVAMQLINEHRVGEHELMDNVIVIAATNRVSDRGTSTYLPTTVYSRFTIVEAIPDYKCWNRYWLQKHKYPLAAAFYEWKKDGAFFSFDPKDREQKCFATPRTNEKAWKLIMDPKLEAHPEVLRAAVIGTVGSVGFDILAFKEVYQKVPKIKDILANPEKIALPDEESMLYATACSVSGFMEKTTIDKLDTFLSRLAPMYQALAWTLAMQRTEGTVDDVLHTDAGLRYSKRLAQVF